MDKLLTVVLERDIGATPPGPVEALTVALIGRQIAIWWIAHLHAHRMLYGAVRRSGAADLPGLDEVDASLLATSGSTRPVARIQAECIGSGRVLGGDALRIEIVARRARFGRGRAFREGHEGCRSCDAWGRWSSPRGAHSGVGSALSISFSRGALCRWGRLLFRRIDRLHIA